MVKGVCACLLVGLIWVPGAAAAPVESRSRLAGVPRCPASSGGLDIVDGSGTIERESIVDLPTGTRLDIDGTLRFAMVLADRSCPNAQYQLEVYGTSPLGAAGAGPQLLGTQTLAGDGAPVVNFSVSYRDFAAVRDPVDFGGMDRCVFVVGTVTSHEVVRDRAPDVGTYTVCPDGIITQPGFE